MNNYALLQASSTSAGTAIVIQAGLGLIGGALLLAQLAALQNPKPTIPSVYPQIRIQGSPKTSGQYPSLFNEMYESSSFSFEENIASFYAQLLDMQEPLGEEFEAVLYDNLWELIVRT